MSVTLIELEEANMLGPKLSKDIPDVSLFGWIAGGAIRRWFNAKEDLSDVDVFFQADLAFVDYCEQLTKAGFTQVNSHANAVTFNKGDLLVQCIRLGFYPTVEKLLDSFDFTVCQFAWDGKKIYATPQSIMSVLRGHLGAHNINRDFAVDSLRRAFKYSRKGFQPCNGTIQKMANSLRGLTEEQVKKAIEVSPGGGLRTVRID